MRDDVEDQESPYVPAGLIGGYYGGIVNTIRDGSLAKYIEKTMIDKSLSKAPEEYKKARELQRMKELTKPIITKGADNVTSIKRLSALEKWMKLNPLKTSLGKGALVGAGAGVGLAGLAQALKGGDDE